MPENSVSVILTVYNHESIIASIFSGIVENASDHVKEIIVLLDGCTDRSAEQIRSVYSRAKAEVVEFITPDLNEVRANNVGLKASRCEYSVIVQDDCLVQEKNFDLRLLKPYSLFPHHLFAVSGRDVDDYVINGIELPAINTFGVDVGSSRDVFGIRDAINRGPLMLNNEKLKQLNYLDENFAPLDGDDIDISIRAFKYFGWVVGCYCVNFYSPQEWRTTTINPQSAMKSWAAKTRNRKILTEIHKDYFSGFKHSIDISLPE